MIEYLKNEAVASLLQKGLVYRKKESTLLRKIANNEIGLKLKTWVKDGAGIRQESETVLIQEHVIARNSQVLATVDGKQIFNEWPIHQDTVLKNYGQSCLDSLTSFFQPYHKKATVQAIELTYDILSLLGVYGDKLLIKVSWSDEPMIAHVGDFITTGGYSISKDDMLAYELI